METPSCNGALTHPVLCTHPLTPTQAEPDPILDNYVLLVVVMSLFVGGTLVVLSGVLLLCKRCWEVHQRFNRCTPQEPPGDPHRCACRTSQVGIPHPGSPFTFPPQGHGRSRENYHYLPGQRHPPYTR